MNWKASLLGAIVVIIAGAAVGVAIGGKTTNHATTRTVAQTITKTVTASAASQVTSASQSSSANSSSAAATSSAPSGSGSQFYADYLTNSNTDLTRVPSNGASANTDPTTLSLKGKTYAHAIAFDLGSSNKLNSIQLPVPGFKHFSATIAGLKTDASAQASYKLVIYKDSDGPSATQLYSAQFTGPSGTQRVSFDTKGATDLVLDWTQQNPSTNPDSGDSFVFADPVVTS